ncbi:response regulator [Methyloversatilis thermotolerans]|uniref:response regulator n=1 Tax=Methyloversatilis thermotolerans TaxID=1346290 RepID=UPI0003728E4A|nr:response regulator [Methyloversatilis thermotolerans]
MRLLLVEDDALLASGVCEGLSAQGFNVDLIDTAEAALGSLKLTHYDLAVIDIGLPRMDGLELVRRLRREGVALPVLILTARDTLEDRVDALELGADDYLIKPFHLSELVARVRALIRRSRAVASSVIVHGALTLDMGTREAMLGSAPLALTGREWATLELLLLAAPRVVAKEKILESLSAWDRELNMNAVELYVSRLRAKLEPGGVRILTVRGLGYRMEAPAR